MSSSVIGSTTPAGDSTNPLTQFLSRLHLTHIIALIAITVGLITSYYLIVAYALSSAFISAITQYVLMTAITIMGFVFIAWSWTVGALGRAYINGSVSASGLSFGGGPQQLTTVGGITPQGIVYQNLSASTLNALNNLIAMGRIPDTLIPLIATMNPQQIQALISLYSATTNAGSKG